MVYLCGSGRFLLLPPGGRKSSPLCFRGPFYIFCCCFLLFRLRFTSFLEQIYRNSVYRIVYVATILHCITILRFHVCDFSLDFFTNRVQIWPRTLKYFEVLLKIAGRLHTVGFYEVMILFAYGPIYLFFCLNFFLSAPPLAKSRARFSFDVGECVRHEYAACKKFIHIYY